MSRTIPATLLTALSQDNVNPFYAVRLDLDSGVVRYWTGLGNKTINGQVYTGLGSVLQVSELEEVSDMGARGCTIALSGIDSAAVSLTLQEPYQGRPCQIYFGVGNNVVEVFSGYLDVMSIEDSGDKSNIIVTVESKLIGLERIVPRRYTNSDQRSRYSTDTFFSYLTKLQDKEVVWGRE